MNPTSSNPPDRITTPSDLKDWLLLTREPPNTSRPHRSSLVAGASTRLAREERRPPTSLHRRSSRMIVLALVSADQSQDLHAQVDPDRPVPGNGGPGTGNPRPDQFLTKRIP